MLDKYVVCFILISKFYFIISLPSIEYRGKEVQELEKTPPDLDLVDMILNSSPVELGNRHGNNANSVKRVKRQGGGAGKFSEAAKMTEVKQFRLFLQMFKNLWASSYVGGGHPLHPDVPKPVILLFKQRIMDFFFPPVGIDAVKQ